MLNCDTDIRQFTCGCCRIAQTKWWDSRTGGPIPWQSYNIEYKAAMEMTNYFYIILKTTTELIFEG
jgi:hypothetical protein